MNDSIYNKSFVVRIAGIAAIGGFLFGFDTGVIGGTQLYFTEYFDLTPGQQGWAVGSALYGCLLGALVAGYLTKAISRKYTLILSAILFCVSAWGSGFANSLNELIVYRVIGGVGIGFASMAAPMYIAEISPSRQRGQMVSLYQLAIVFGFFAVFLATYVIGGGNAEGISQSDLAVSHSYNQEHGWRLMFWSELLPAGLFLIALFFVPHSPRWLILKGRHEEAERVLQKLYTDNSTAQLHLSEIQQSFREVQITNVKMLLASGLGFALLLGIMLSVFQQITGINAILYYGAEIFSNALGYGPQDALKQQLLLGAVNLIFTFLALYTIDRWGRKPLFLTGTAGMMIGLSVLGVTLYTNAIGVLSLIAILVFIGSFAMSMGPVVWVILAEIFPNRARSIAMSIAVAAQWLFNGIVATSFPLVNRSELNDAEFNGALPYFIFASFCVLAFIFVWKYLPETKGKSLEEIEKIW
ncbi:MAG: SP family xylose:H+ symportor-like MFS transporter [Arenicella sp.]|jgi:SP family xylose:H+ symportor-like MFS transporter